MSAYDVSAWADFAIAAAVVSVVVLAVCVGPLAPLLAGPLRSRTALTLALPLDLALVALCLLVPGQSDSAVGGEIIAAAGVLGLAVVIWFGTTTPAADEPRPARPVTLVALLLPVLLLLVGGTSLAAASFGGLTWVFAAVVAGLVGTSVSAGLLVVETGR